MIELQTSEGVVMDQEQMRMVVAARWVVAGRTKARYQPQFENAVGLLENVRILPLTLLEAESGSTGPRYVADYQRSDGFVRSHAADWVERYCWAIVRERGNLFAARESWINRFNEWHHRWESRETWEQASRAADALEAYFLGLCAAQLDWALVLWKWSSWRNVWLDPFDAVRAMTDSGEELRVAVVPRLALELERDAHPHESDDLMTVPLRAWHRSVAMAVAMYVTGGTLAERCMAWDLAPIPEYRRSDVAPGPVLHAKRIPAFVPDSGTPLQRVPRVGLKTLSKGDLSVLADRAIYDAPLPWDTSEWPILRSALAREDFLNHPERTETVVTMQALSRQGHDDLPWDVDLREVEATSLVGLAANGRRLLRALESDDPASEILKPVIDLPAYRVPVGTAGYEFHALTCAALGTKSRAGKVGAIERLPLAEAMRKTVRECKQCGDFSVNALVGERRKYVEDVLRDREMRETVAKVRVHHFD